LKILFIIPSITNYHTFLNELTQALVNKGHKVSLLAGEKSIVKGPSPYSNPENCEWVPINFPRSFQPQEHVHASLLIDKQIKRIKPDIIHIHFSAAMFTVALAYKKRWPITIATIHGLAWPSRNGTTRYLLKNAEIRSARKMDEVLVLNNEDLTSLRENGLKNVKLLPGEGMGCSITEFNPDSIDINKKESLKKELGINDRDFVFIFIGRQTHFKGFHLVIRAFMQVYHSKSNFKLLLVGEKDRIHPSGLNATEDELMQLIPAIINVGWKKNVNDYLALADVNVFPSKREGLPVNLMESMAMGVPIIAVDTRGSRDIVKNGKNGILLNDNNVDHIARAMKQMGSDFVLRKKLSENAFNERAKFDRQHYIGYQISYYENLMEKK